MSEKVLEEICRYLEGHNMQSAAETLKQERGNDFKHLVERQLAGSNQHKDNIQTQMMDMLIKSIREEERKTGTETQPLEMIDRKQAPHAKIMANC